MPYEPYFSPDVEMRTCIFDWKIPLQSTLSMLFASECIWNYNIRKVRQLLRFNENSKSSASIVFLNRYRETLESIQDHAEHSPRISHLLDHLVWKRNEGGRSYQELQAYTDYLATRADYEISEIRYALLDIVKEMSQTHLKPIWEDRKREKVFQIVHDVDRFQHHSTGGRAQLLPRARLVLTRRVHAPA